MAFNTKLIIKLLLDGVATFLVGLPFFLLYFIGDPFRRGFFCDDESIRYPFKPSTISSELLFSVSIIVSIVVISTTEYMRLPGMKPGSLEPQQPIKQFIWIIYHQLIVFAFGALASQSLTDIAKYTIGRLRPHFIDVCKPTPDCQKDSALMYKYIENYQCEESPRLRDSRLSFMSGHSSFSAYCAVYIAIYLQSRIRSQRLALPRSFLQVLFIYLSIYTGFTRISDYKHHWSDVLVGLIQGSLLAILTARYVANLFRLTTATSGLKEKNEELSSATDQDLRQNQSQRNYSSFEVEPM